MAEIRHLGNWHDVIFFCRGWSDLDKISHTGAEWHVDCGDWSKSKPDVEFQLEMGIEPNANRTRTHVVKHLELEPNRTHQCDEPEPSDPGSGWVRQICRLAGKFAVNAQHPSAIFYDVRYQVLVRPFRNSMLTTSPVTSTPHVRCFVTCYRVLASAPTAVAKDGRFS